MISVCFTPETGALNVLVHSKTGVPVYIMTGWADDKEPVVSQVSSRSESDQIWMPTDIRFGWYHILAMTRSALFQDEQFGLECGVLKMDTITLLSAMNEPVYITFSLSEVKALESITMLAYGLHSGVASSSMHNVPQFEALPADYH